MRILNKQTYKLCIHMYVNMCFAVCQVKQWVTRRGPLRAPQWLNALDICFFRVTVKCLHLLVVRTQFTNGNYLIHYGTNVQVRFTRYATN